MPRVQTLSAPRERQRGGKYSGRGCINGGANRCCRSCERTCPAVGVQTQKDGARCDCRWPRRQRAWRRGAHDGARETVTAVALREWRKWPRRKHAPACAERRGKGEEGGVVRRTQERLMSAGFARTLFAGSARHTNASAANDSVEKTYTPLPTDRVAEAHRLRLVPLMFRKRTSGSELEGIMHHQTWLAAGKQNRQASAHAVSRMVCSLAFPQGAQRTQTHTHACRAHHSLLLPTRKPCRAVSTSRAFSVRGMQ